MASILPISAGTTTSSTTNATDSAASRVPQKKLGQDDFMKLLAVQFQMQDPLKPMEDTAFIAQTAQFSALEQSTAAATQLTQLVADQQRVIANSYLGHHVKLDAGQGKTAEGDVTAVDNSGNKPLLVVNGKLYSISAVLRVGEPAVTSAPNP